MSDPPDERSPDAGDRDRRSVDGPATERDAVQSDQTPVTATGDGDQPDPSTLEDGSEDETGRPADTEGDLEALRQRVEEKYDFDDFGPSDMAEMTPEEWDVAFDPDTWITGDALLERVEAELKSRIADREVFATLEYARIDGHRCLVAYSDTDYAVIFPDGSVEGQGTVVRDVKPTVALCSMDSYEVADPPEDWHLPEPENLSGERSELGNWMLQLLAFAQLIIGLVAIGLWLWLGLESQLILGVVGIFLVIIALILFLMVANARLSDRFRMEEYEQRLRTIGSGERPSFLPIEDDAFEEGSLEAGEEASRPSLEE